MSPSVQNNGTNWNSVRRQFCTRSLGYTTSRLKCTLTSVNKQPQIRECKGLIMCVKLLMTTPNHTHTHTLTLRPYRTVVLDYVVTRACVDYCCSSCCLELTQWLLHDPLMGLPVSRWLYMCGYKCGCTHRQCIPILNAAQKDISYKLRLLKCDLMVFSKYVQQ